MKRLVAFAIVLLNLPGSSWSLSLGSDVRIKDVAKVAGTREVELIGYGLVIGLDGTGDKPGTYPAVGSLTNMLRKLGVNVSQADLGANNVASVAVTARIPAFASAGTALDATVSSLGTATSLKGGTLVLTPLQGNDGKVVASAQGKILVATNSEGKRGSGSDKSGTTVGSLPGGVLLEQDITSPLLQEGRFIDIALNQPDFVTADRLAKAIETATGLPCQRLSPGRVRVEPTAEGVADPVGFAAKLEVLTFQPDQPSKVVIDEHTGTVMAGQNIHLSPVAISHGRLKIEVSDKGRSSGGSVVVMPEGATVTTLVAMLNGIGIAPGDIAAIFKTLQRVGALKADLVIL